MSLMVICKRTQNLDDFVSGSSRDEATRRDVLRNEGARGKTSVGAAGIMSELESLDSGSSELESLDSGSSDLVSLNSGSSELESLDSGSSELESLDSGSSELESLDSGSSELESLDSGSSELESLDSGSPGCSLNRPAQRIYSLC
ncbi:hypothetical protein FHG87_017834 [Trinorchestia longiramus]|nr:hypothetical protein FHG87_017834 [Trinorchestia longiramus]